MIASLVHVVVSLATCLAQDAAADRQPIEAWLIAGPEPVRLPAFHDDGTRGHSLAELLGEDPVDFRRLDPRAGDPLRVLSGEPLSWQESPLFFVGSQPYPQRALLANQVVVDRWVKAKLVFRTHHLLRVLLDGAEIAKKTSVESAEAVAPGELVCSVALSPGAHRLALVSVFSTAGSDDWTVEAALEQDAAGRQAKVTFSTSAERPLSIDDLLDTEAVSTLLTAPDGRHVAAILRRPEVPSDHSQYWIEIRTTANGRVVYTSEEIGGLGGFAWHPDARSFLFTTTRGDRSSVFLAELDGPTRPILTDIPDLADVRIAPDGSSLIYARSETPKAAGTGLMRLRGLTDRLPGARSVTHLYQASLGALGERRRLTAGPISCDLEDIAADGRSLLFTRVRRDLTERPFECTDLLELDLDTLAVRSLTHSGSIRTALYSPDGRRVLVSGGDTFYRERTPGGTDRPIPNDYDGQLFLIDRESGAIDYLTRDFAPSVLQAEWPRGGDGAIWIRAEDGLAVRIYRVDADEHRFTPLPSAVDVVERMSLAADGSGLVYLGSGAGVPPQIMAIDLDGGSASPRHLATPGQATWERAEMGRVERCDFTSAAGDRILGRVHLPPGFDPQQRYPAIVFYYGGTSPTSMTFGGRYPLELWAAHGYVVYNLIPSGATGQGEEFARRHVNDWGKASAEEILQGVDAFLAAWPAVDPARVGCIGASFGGFMTMRLITLTDRFACAVSHAGISSISSYWGEGNWGHLYSAVATADRYPWNDRDIYVERSPLFHADAIHTPLLLSHGTADSNVPIGESEQLYTALRLLGRDVEMVRIEGENHHILDYPKRKRWMQVILAWFDKHLKGEAAWWDELWQ